MMEKKVVPGTLSVCMIVKNEERILGRCLQSVKTAADQLIVADTGSSDSTADIARNFGAEIINVKWDDDFSAARNASIKNATGDWILWLDADDVVPPESIPLLCNIKKQKPDRVLGFIVRNQRPGNTGTEFVQARMFPNRPDLFFERRIHEQIMPSALRAGLIMENRPVIIEHHGYADPGILKSKARRNVKLLLEDYRAGNNDPVMAVEIADSYTLLEEYREAEVWYQKVLAIPGCRQSFTNISSQALLGLGNICNRQKNFSQAVEYLKEAAILSPWRTDNLFSLAVAYEMNGQTEDAVAILKNIISTEPRPGQVGVDFRTASIKAFLRLIRILTEQEKLESAAAFVCDSLRRHGDRPEIRNTAGKFYLKTGKLMDGLHEFEKSLQLVTEGNLEAYIGLCVIFYKAGAQDRMRETLNTIMPLFSGNPKFEAFKRFALGPAESGTDENLQELRREFFYAL